MRRLVIPLMLATAGLLAVAGPLHAKRATPCPAGRFLLAAAGSPVLGGGAGSVDAVTIGSDGTAALGTCGATRAAVRGKAHFTTVRALWASCGSLAKVRLKARLAAPACGELMGTLRAKRVPPESLRAVRSVCGDGIVDGPAGEECEPSTAGGDSACPGACGAAAASAACRCGDIATTTTLPPTTTSSSSSTTTSTSTSSTSTSSSTSTTSSSTVSTTTVTTTSTTIPCLDDDADGWTTCDDDCCDAPADCSNPALVNPGALEVDGNLVDDDCDGTPDNPPGPCDVGLASNASNPLDYVKAIDLCQTTTESPPTLAEKRWGVISAELLLADGTGTPATSSRSIRSAFGSNALPLNGLGLAVLSTGNAAATGQTSPPSASFQLGQDEGTSSTAPADWLAANGGAFPTAPGCPASSGTTANDPIMLRVRVRVPTNAKSFTVGTFFYSSEFPEWVCSPFNDVFVTLLDSTFVPAMGEVANPADKNLAFYDPPPAGGSVYPLGANLAFGDTGLFQQCLNGPIGCATGAVAGTISTCTSTSQLTGTGFEVAPSEGSPLSCGMSNHVGGGTGWLVTSGNVTPGETIEVRFVIWDTSDPQYDSLVLLDNWVWSLATAEPGTH